MINWIKTWITRLQFGQIEVDHEGNPVRHCGFDFGALVRRK